MKKDFITIKDLTVREIDDLFALTKELKADKLKYNKVLSGKTLALVFQKPSNRTRVSFDVGMYQLGGNSIYLSPDEINLGVRESIEDVAKTLSRYVDGIVIRTFEHKNVLDLARFSAVPVINGLSDFSHPCQAMADIFTVKESFSSVKGRTLAYIGDGNNVCNSLMFICAKTGMNIHVAAPKGYEPSEQVTLDSKEIARESSAQVKIFHDAFAAAAGVDVLYTDVWASMGQEQEAQSRKQVFKDFQINMRLIEAAKSDCLVMHCLPAHRGEEITADAMESAHSVIFEQAENRMHVQKAILIKLLA